MLNEKIDLILKKYNISNDDKSNFLNIINPIVKHEEFQRRMTSEFLHHGNITLGEHIIEDAVVTYLLSKKSKKNINLALAVKIAMLHDLYTVSWQNTEKVIKEKKFFNKHGFRHPVEAIINAYNWYPELFKDEYDTKVIIDGVIHHMYPLPVSKFADSKDNILELKNFESVSNLPQEIKDIIVDSTKRKGLGRISLCRSKYIEGRIMSKADKKVSVGQFKNISSVLALFTGVNKKLERK